MGGRTRVCSALAIALGLFAASPAAATVIVVPLPQLAGTFSCSEPTYTRCFETIAVHLPVHPSVIRSVSLRVRGTTSLATVQCDTYPPFAQATTIDAELYEPGQGSNNWYAFHMNLASGAVDYTEPFEPYPASNTWAFLLDGSAELRISYVGFSPYPECFTVGPPDSTTLDDVTLFVEGEFATATRASSWGRVKFLYR